MNHDLIYYTDRVKSLADQYAHLRNHPEQDVSRTRRNDIIAALLETQEERRKLWQGKVAPDTGTPVGPTSRELLEAIRAERQPTVDRVVIALTPENRQAFASMEDYAEALRPALEAEEGPFAGSLANAAFRQQAEELDAAKATVHDQAREIDALSDVVRGLQKKLATVSKEYEADLKAQAEEIEQLTATVDNLRSLRERDMQEFVQLKTDLEAARRANGALRQHIERLHGKLARGGCERTKLLQDVIRDLIKNGYDDGGLQIGDHYLETPRGILAWLNISPTKA